jgi:PleD family two-component response regulator
LATVCEIGARGQGGLTDTAEENLRVRDSSSLWRPPACVDLPQSVGRRCGLRYRHFHAELYSSRGSLSLTKRILIADDYESVLRGVRAMLEAHSGWEVYGEAVNRYEALTKAIRTETDLIILDLAMAEVEDLKAADEISKLLAGVQMVGTR